MSTHVRSALAVLLFCALCLTVRPAETEPPISPTPSILMDFQGQVEYRPDSKAEWRPAYLGQTLAPGSQIRTTGVARASVQFADGALLRLPPSTTLTLNEWDAERSSPGAQFERVIDAVFVTVLGRPGDGEINTPTIAGSVRG